MTIACGGGASQPRAGVPDVVSYGATAIAQLVLARAPFLRPFLPLMPTINVPTDTFCATDPPAMPAWTAGEVGDLLTPGSAGFAAASLKLRDTVLNIVWFQLCECASVATPPGPTAAPPAQLPLQPSSSSTPCWLDTRSQLVPSGTATPPWPNTSDPAFYMWCSPKDSAAHSFTWTPLPPNANSMRFSLFVDVEPLGGPSIAANMWWAFSPTQDSVPGVSNSIFAFDQIAKAQTVGFDPLNRFFGVGFEPLLAPRECRWTVTAEAFCGVPPDQLAAACCPPDQGIVDQLLHLATQISDIQAALGTASVLVELSRQTLTPEGEATLPLGTRAVSIELTALGSQAYTSALGRPRGLMRVGSVRWGDGIGYSPRRFIDADRFDDTRPAGATTLSWQLLAGTEAILKYLG